MNQNSMSGHYHVTILNQTQSARSAALLAAASCSLCASTMWMEAVHSYRNVSDLNHNTHWHIPNGSSLQCPRCEYFKSDTEVTSLQLQSHNHPDKVLYVNPDLKLYTSLSEQFIPSYPLLYFEKHMWPVRVTGNLVSYSTAIVCIYTIICF
jgi:hypothetical protein